MIELEQVRKTYGGGVALDSVSFRVPPGEITVLIGPSGCGKTTLLRLVNKLLTLDGGTIRVAGRDIADEEPVRLRRGMGYAIQQVGLFPHMTIAQNIGVVPSLEDWPTERIRARVEELLVLVGLDAKEYGGRFPRSLSGGEAQRVGVARALAADPPVLLMDEPFGALDPVTRERLQDEFLNIQSQLRKTVLLVSHDMEEALRLGDRIVMMREGQVEQNGRPADILLHPATPFVAEFLGKGRAFQQRAGLPIRLARDSAASPQNEKIEKGGKPETAPTLSEEMPVRDALLAMGEANAASARLADSEGRGTGIVTLRSVTALLAGGAPHHDGES